jgi:CubicO group peptidase (beta-lactamase class C family)
MDRPRTLPELARAWEERLHGLIDSLDVPGAVLGVSWQGERVVLAGGIAGLRNPQPVTADTVFQLGSISQIYTATLIARLAGADLSLLHRPVAQLVPEAGWMSPEILVRHLLTHSSGLGGDHFADTGPDDGCLARYVVELEALPRDVPGPPGHRYSSCNGGFAVLGRLVEVLAGTSFDVALRDLLTAPLHAAATCTLPEEAILWPVALGHDRPETTRPPGELTADEVWSFPRSCGPLGGVCANAGDVLALAELHLAGGRTRDGATLLEPATVAEMRRRHLEAPPLARPSARGLGWGIYDWPGAELVGHDGETTGQIAKLRLLLAEGLALVVLTNAIPDGGRLARELETAVLADFGLTPPVIPTPAPQPSFDARPYEGRYRNLEGTIEVAAVPGGLRTVARQEGEGLSGSVHATELRPLGDGAFIDTDEPSPVSAVRFGDPGPDGRCRSYFDGRVAWRVLESAD